MNFVKRIFKDTFEREQQLLLDSPPVKGFDRKTALIFFYTPLALTVIKYYGQVAFFSGVLETWGFHDAAVSLSKWANDYNTGNLHSLEWWAGTMITCYMLVPVLLIKFVLREKLSDFGFKWNGAFKEWWLYVVMIAIMMPLVYFFSSTISFQNRYPFYDPGHFNTDWHGLITWECIYFCIFFSLEFFFRGFLTLGLRHRFGYYSVFIMTIPYCMIHFTKPMPETIGAIFAGIILGTLSMKSRSVYLGVFIHFSIAIAMDLFSLWRKGYF